jgi:hypothetical protein
MASNPGAGEKSKSEKALPWLTLGCTLLGMTWTALVYFDQRSIDTTLKGQEAQLNSLKIREESQARVTGESKVEIKSSQGEFATASFSIQIHNISKSDVEISWILLHWYIGKLNPGSASGNVWRINSPPDKYRGKSDPGSVDWGEPIDYALFTYPGWKIPPDYSTLLRFAGKARQGGATKTLKSGDSCSFSYDFVVPKSANSWIGFVASVGTDRGNGGEHLFRYEEAIRLPERPVRRAGRKLATSPVAALGWQG